MPGRATHRAGEIGTAQRDVRRVYRYWNIEEMLYAQRYFKDEEAI